MAAIASTEPRWLTAQEQLAWRRLAAVLLTLPASMDAQLQRDAGLTLFDYIVLSTLSDEPSHTCRMNVVAARTSSSLSRLSHVITKLEARGWVRREPLPGNRRVTMATLTDSGLDQVVRTAPGHTQHVRAVVFDQLSAKQVRDLASIGASLLTKLDPDNNFTMTH